MFWSVEFILNLFYPKVTKSCTFNTYVLVYTCSEVLKLTSAEKGTIYYIAGVGKSEQGLLSLGNIIRSV